MRIKNCLTLAATASATLFALASVAQAHPGHPVEVVSSYSPLHLLFQPEHAVAWVAAFGVIAVVVGRLVASRPGVAPVAQPVED